MKAQIVFGYRGDIGVCPADRGFKALLAQKL
jgi:hypothetical protein